MKTISKYIFYIVAIGLPIVAFAAPDNLPIRVESLAELDRMRDHLESLYAPQDVLHAFQHPSGEMIDCIDIYQQPGLRRAGMHNHVIANPPTLPITPDGLDGNTQGAVAPKVARISSLPGGIDPNGAERRCPEMTIPVRRTTLDEMKRFKNLKDFLNKVPSHLAKTATDLDLSSPDYADPQALEQIIPPLAGPNAYHQYAHAAQYGVTNYGAHSVFNLWNPAVQSGVEFSLSQLWVTRGSDSNLETLEAGIQVYPNKYGDNNARLFVYSTSDGYSGNNSSADKASGCYNLDCGRFVQTNPDIIIGGLFSAYSVTGGTQQEVEIAFHHGGTPTPQWWLFVGGVAVGYYPLDLFDATGVQDYASNIDFGGEIIDDRTAHTYHTETDMGSGAYPSAGFGQAAYQRKIGYFPTPTTAENATGLQPYRDNAYCYDISAIGSDPNWGIYFYFGGPGYNANCT